MSTLCAFFGIDSRPENERGHASAYLASDSYITDDHGNVLKTDAQKVFASAVTPAIFGYVGDEKIAEMLAKAVDQLDAPRGLFWGSYGSAACANVLENFFAAEIPLTRELTYDSTVIYIGRAYGKTANESRFHIWQFSRPKKGDWSPTEFEVPARSGPPMANGCPVGFWGTGGPLLQLLGEHPLGRLENYKEFTWAYFRALGEALQKDHDERSGGSIQVGFLPRGGNGQYVGIVRDDQRFVCGKVLSEKSPPVARWVDKDFDECDPETLEKRLDRKRSPIIKELPRS